MCVINHHSYEWGYTYGAPQAVSPVNRIRRVLDYAVTVMPAGKIMMGFSNYAYDWTLPWKQGTAARVLSNAGALELAASRWAEDGAEARRLVRGRAQHPGAAEAHRRIRPRRAQHLDGRSPLEADLRPAREHVQRGKDHLKRYAQRRGEYSRKPYAALKSPRFSFKVTKIKPSAC